MLTNKTILITGGTGSFGNKFVERLLSEYKLKKIIIYSRDEYKQYIMRKKFSQHEDVLRYFLGDIRDSTRIYRAFEEVDYVVHAAALKQVPALEYNPIEAVRTNIDGASNIINAAINAHVKKVIFLSTDKAVNPVNLYGATKLVAEKLFIAANEYAGGKVKFSAVRYGNVIGSRGSVVPLFVGLKQDGITEFPITHFDMTRFWITLDKAVDLVLTALRESVGGEIFVPKIPSMKISDMAKAIEPSCTFKITGIRPGEKIHEKLISSDESAGTRDMGDIYIIIPSFFQSVPLKKYDKYVSVKNGFSFSSDANKMHLSGKDLLQIIGEENK